MQVTVTLKYGIAMNPTTETPQTTGTMGLLSQLNRVVYRRATEDVIGMQPEAADRARTSCATTKAACSRSSARR